MAQRLLWTPHTSFFKPNLSFTTPHRLLLHPRSSSTNPLLFSNLPRRSSTIQSVNKVKPPPFFWGDTPEHEFYKSQGVRNSKSYFKTLNGNIFTQSWLPIDQTQPIKAAVFMTHGYGSDSSWCFQKICIEFANWGYAVFAADLLGHGRSDGLHGYIGDMDNAAATSLSYFLSVRRSETYCKLPAFMFGESMGGMITMLMYLQSQLDTWTGLIFSAPLFVTPEKMTPSKACGYMGGNA